MTLLEIWKQTIEDSLNQMILPEDDISKEDAFNSLVEAHRHYIVTFVDEEDLTEEQRLELLGEEDDEFIDVEDSLEPLLFEYGRIMLWREKEWIEEKIQELLNRQIS